MTAISHLLSPISSAAGGFTSPWWLPALTTYLGVIILGLAAWPWWSLVWSGRRDRGAGLWLAGGIFVFLLAMQVTWKIGLLELHAVWAWLILIAVGLSGRGLLPRQTPCAATRALQRKAALQALLIFTALFWFWALIRSADPGILHTEQPMDVMWMRSAMSSAPPPIRDSWFGGEAATYYADGHQALGFLGIAFGLPPALAVNTGQILWFALTGLLAFQAGSSICRSTSPALQKRSGLLSLLLVLFVSTVPGSVDAFTQHRPWWWWDASRVLRDGATELITEFPFFSFYLGDNHAHLLGVPVLLLSLMASLQLIRPKKLSFLLLLPAALCMSWSWRMNPWQTPTSIALPFLALLVRGKRLSGREIASLALILISALLFALPRLAPGPQMELAWNRYGSTSAIEFVRVFGFLLPGAVWAGFRADPRFRFPLAVLLLILGMWGVCEVLVLRDLFQSRMNTVFKVYFQIWILLGVVAAAGWTRAMRKGESLRGLAVVSLIFCLIPGLATAGRSTREALSPHTRSLHAWSVLPERDQIYLRAADRLIQPGDLILEAPGDSYRADTSVLGTWTAGDTLLGWRGHQVQWRPGQPQPDALQLYRADSRQELKQLLQRLRPDWVLWGPHERDAVVIHPDWVNWMDENADRLIDDPSRILFRIRAVTP